LQHVHLQSWNNKGNYYGVLDIFFRQKRCYSQPPIASWGGEVPDWDFEPYSSDEEFENDIEAEILGPDGGGGSEFAFQNALAAGLLVALAMSIGNVLLKLIVVAFALVSTAFRYTAVGFLVLFILALFS